MGLFDLFKRKTEDSNVEGTLEYIPGSQTPTQDEPISVEGGELVKRMFVQPEGQAQTEHSSIRIYTGNPFRDLNSAMRFAS